MAETPPSSIRIPRDVKEAAQARADAQGKTLTDVVVDFLKSYGRPPTPCLAILPNGVRCDEPIIYNAGANAWWHEDRAMKFRHTATGPA